jgi:hypothetical protein
MTGRTVAAGVIGALAVVLFSHVLFVLGLRRG